MPRSSIAPRPTGSTRRPFERRSTVVVSRATFQGLRLESGLMMAPSRTRSVARAMAPISAQGS